MEEIPEEETMDQTQEEVQEMEIKIQEKEIREMEEEIHKEWLFNQLQELVFV